MAVDWLVVSAAAMKSNSAKTVAKLVTQPPTVWTMTSSLAEMKVAGQPRDAQERNGRNPSPPPYI